MANNSNAVGNQKVFVELGSVLELQKNIERLVSQMPDTGVPADRAAYYHARGLYSAARMLGIPLSLTEKAERLVH